MDRIGLVGCAGGRRPVRVVGGTEDRLGSGCHNLTFRIHTRGGTFRIGQDSAGCQDHGSLGMILKLLQITCCRCTRRRRRLFPHSVCLLEPNDSQYKYKFDSRSFDVLVKKKRKRKTSIFFFKRRNIKVNFFTA